MSDLASKINAYLTPARRQAIYRLLLIAGVIVTAVSPAFSSVVETWTAVLMAAGTVASLILAAIVTRAPQWPIIYAALAALVTALVGASVLTQTLADTVLRVLQAVITAAPLLVILARTDTRTIDGSPQAEVILTDPVPDPAYVPPVAPVTPVSTVQYENGAIETRYSDGTTTTDPGIGNPPTASLS